MNAEKNIADILNALSNEINQLYGYVTIPGDNFGEPAINSGPCGPFANTFCVLLIAQAIFLLSHLSYTIVIQFGLGARHEEPKPRNTMRDGE